MAIFLICLAAGNLTAAVILTGCGLLNKPAPEQ